MLLAFAGCSDDDGERTEATPPAAGTTSQQQATPEPAQRRRPVRLLRLGRFNEPTFLTAPRGDRRRFVVEREGRIRVVQGGRVLGRPFLDISNRVQTGGESGLLSMAFARDYRSSRRFWVYYTDNRGFIQIDQFRAAVGHAEPGRPGLAPVGDPRARTSASTTRAASSRSARTGCSTPASATAAPAATRTRTRRTWAACSGKLIRISPRPGGGYSIPSDNPFRGRSGARPEIYAYGLRNPYRFSFDRRRGHLTVGDVGQDEIEEIDFVPGRSGGRRPRGGYNFGWDAFEGRNRYEGGSAPGHVPPVIQHTHGEGFCSITGGYVIRDRSLGRGWTGRYIYGDYCNATLRLAHLRRPRASSRATGLRVDSLVSFGEDGRGRVYAVSLDGPVYRIGRR